MLASCLSAGVMVNLIRYVSTDVNTYQIVFFRNFFALLLFLPWLFFGGIKKIKTNRMNIYFLRGAVGICAMTLWFHSLSIIPLTVSTALSFTVPLFVAVMSAFFFGEKYGPHRIAALIVGFIGTLIILRPGTEDFNMNSLFVLGATIFWAISSIIIKSASSTDSPGVISFYAVLFMTPFSVPLAYLHWEEISMVSIYWLLALAFISNIFQVCLSIAISSTDFRVILPFDFTRLIFVAIIAYFAFDEIIDMWTSIGALVIMASAVYASYRESLKQKNKRLHYGGIARNY